MLCVQHVNSFYVGGAVNFDQLVLAGLCYCVALCIVQRRRGGSLFCQGRVINLEITLFRYYYLYYQFEFFEISN